MYKMTYTIRHKSIVSNRNRQNRSMSMKGGALTDEKRKFIIQCMIGNSAGTDRDTKSCIQRSDFDELERRLLQTPEGKSVKDYLGTRAIERITNWMRYTQRSFYTECIKKYDETGSHASSGRSNSGSAKSGSAESGRYKSGSAQLERDRIEHKRRMAAEARERALEFEERNRYMAEQERIKEQRYQESHRQYEIERAITAQKKATSDHYKRVERGLNDTWM